MHSYIAHLLQVYGYWGLCGALALEYVLAVPAETILTTTGIFYRQYHLHLFWLILATSVGTFAGSLFAYAVGRTLGRPFLIRYGKYVRLTPEHIDKAESLFAKYTVPTLVISRYIAVIRILVPYLAGINKIRLSVFSITVFLTSLLWTSTFILAGSLIERAWQTVIHHWKQDLIPAVLILIVVLVGYWYLHRWLARKMETPMDSQSSHDRTENE